MKGIKVAEHKIFLLQDQSMKRHYEEFQNFALELVEIPSSIIKSYYKKSATEYKVDGSEVTLADREAEKRIREKISERYPDHKILGEEFNIGGKTDSSYAWIIDPLDGTTWFTLGVPIFGTLIALLEEGKPVMGVIHFPISGETIYAAKNLGCWRKINNEKPVRVYVDKNPGITLSNAVISASGVHKTDIHPSNTGKNINLTALIKKAGKFRFCGDCLQHSLVAQGSIHAAVDTIMQPWDTAAIIPCIEEAGGIVTTMDGGKDDIVFGGSLVTSCNKRLHDELLEVLNS